MELIRYLLILGLSYIGVTLYYYIKDKRKK